jgi:hypothetical protein
MYQNGKYTAALAEGVLFPLHRPADTLHVRTIFANAHHLNEQDSTACFYPQPFSPTLSALRNHGKAHSAAFFPHPTFR